MQRLVQFALVVLVALVALHSPMCEAQPTVMKPLLNQMAPQLMVAEWMNTARPLTAKDLRGKVVLLEFWATW
ncbi:MAG: hypothetical protein FJ279_01970 [Planctomycetes bacterium]|nr:hypothetical protein [Planctomycetota bacterium]